ncbi:MAG: nucleoside/nucleotide kinase family protein [Alphaproteobacteria bacterium]|nr:nucleoside/nucleotide kinase family protein [Alphaproteobacteria bacterium]
MADTVESIYASIIGAMTDRRRILVGVAGPPGVGKSTLSTQLCKRLADDGHAAAIIPMDGFHLDNAILRDRGLLHRKGAPETFDVMGFISLVHSLREGKDPVPVPHFDRDADRVREAAETVDTTCKVLLLEGNYLLLDRQPWIVLQELFDLSVFVKAPQSVLRRRLIQRWLDFDHNRNDAERRANENDIPNARLVLEHSVPADLTLAFEEGD